MTTATVHGLVGAQLPQINWQEHQWLKGSFPRQSAVTLVAFCSIHTLASRTVLPYLNRWQALYSPHGLELVMIHIPSFSFDANPAHVQHVLNTTPLNWPVIHDSHHKLADQFRILAWPRLLLVSRHGRIMSDHVGRAGMNQVEQAIRSALFHAGQTQLPPTTEVSEPAYHELHSASPDMPLGYRSGLFRNVDSIRKDQPRQYSAPTSRSPGVALHGTWTVRPHAIHTDTHDNSDAFLSTVFSGHNAWIVAEAASSNAHFSVTLNNEPLQDYSLGKDVQLDANKSIVSITHPGLYHLVASPRLLSPAELKLSPLHGSAHFHQFSFDSE